MDFDKPKVYGDTFISDGLVNIDLQLYIKRSKIIKGEIQCYRLDKSSVFYGSLVGRAVAARVSFQAGALL